MLSKNEELRLEKILEEITRDINRYFYLTSTESLWLAEKLKEVNEELKLQSDNSDHCFDHCICLVCMK